MDDILVEKVLNNEMTQDEAVEEAYNPEYLLKALNMRRSMRYCLKTAILSYQLKEIYKNIENYRDMANYSQVSTQLLSTYSNELYQYTRADNISANIYNIEGLKYTPIVKPTIKNNQVITTATLDISNHRITRIVTDDIKSIFKESSTKEFETKIENLTQMSLDKYKSVKGYSYASIFQGLSEIIGYLAGALGG